MAAYRAFAIRVTANLAATLCVHLPGVSVEGFEFGEVELPEPGVLWSLFDRPDRFLPELLPPEEPAAPELLFCEPGVLPRVPGILF